MTTRDIRCDRCNRKLASAGGVRYLQIKCPRCGMVNTQRATSSDTTPSKEPTRGYTNHSMDGRQAPPG
ncbi:Com family DNA-binding transcriptional regulator [Billgrantia ethanolica]|uniref:Com family DNA-binding transcriptional regulator n=1 Tax=Billgrantia ethanolica TaxID=2733486 RepID=A0ABS9A6I5_9GAMM|nr:Com family DNA-binding transcriptional regulator [Halomonas ethanolica]